MQMLQVLGPMGQDCLFIKFCCCFDCTRVAWMPEVGECWSQTELSWATCTILWMYRRLRARNLLRGHGKFHACRSRIQLYKFYLTCMLACRDCMHHRSMLCFWCMKAWRSNGRWHSLSIPVCGSLGLWVFWACLDSTRGMRRSNLGNRQWGACFEKFWKFRNLLLFQNSDSSAAVVATMVLK